MSSWWFADISNCSFSMKSFREGIFADTTHLQTVTWGLPSLGCFCFQEHLHIRQSSNQGGDRLLWPHSGRETVCHAVLRHAHLPRLQLPHLSVGDRKQWTALCCLPAHWLLGRDGGFVDVWRILLKLWFSFSCFKSDILWQLTNLCPAE